MQQFSRGCTVKYAAASVSATQRPHYLLIGAAAVLLPPSDRPDNASPVLAARRFGVDTAGHAKRLSGFNVDSAPVPALCIKTSKEIEGAV